jgi:hypothetical protein
LWRALAFSSTPISSRIAPNNTFHFDLRIDVRVATSLISGELGGLQKIDEVHVEEWKRMCPLCDYTCRQW